MVLAARIVVIFTAETEILNHHRISAGLRPHTEKPTGPAWDRPVTKYSLAQIVHSQAHPRHRFFGRGDFRRFRFGVHRMRSGSAVCFWGSPNEESVPFEATGELPLILTHTERIQRKSWQLGKEGTCGRSYALGGEH